MKRIILKIRDWRAESPVFYTFTENILTITIGSVVGFILAMSFIRFWFHL
jgi:hypothetical protein